MRLSAALLAGLVMGWLLNDWWQRGHQTAAEPDDAQARESMAQGGARSPGDAGAPPGEPAPVNVITQEIVGDPVQSTTVPFDELVVQCHNGQGEPPSDACSDAVIGLATRDAAGDTGFREILENWLIEYPADSRAGLALTESALDRADYPYALDVLRRIEGYLPRSVTQEGAPEPIRGQVTRALASDGLRRDADARMRWLGSLVELFPAERAWRFTLADTLAETGEYQRSLDMLAFLLYDPEYAERAERLRESVVEKLQLSSHEAVPLERIGDQFLITVIVNRQHPVRVLVDTGASVTALSADALTRLGKDRALADVQLETANGAVRSRLYQLDSLAAGNQAVRDLKVVSLESGLRNAEGLLGMNYLSRFHFTIDQRSNLLYLGPR